MGREIEENLAREMLAWCFLPRDHRLRRRLPDGTRLLVTPGKTFRSDNMQEIRRRHIDAWEWAIEALVRAPGYIVCRVRLNGTIEREGQRLYANEFTALWLGDATQLVNVFVCDVVEQFLLRERQTGHEPDWLLWNALATKRAWLAGLATIEELAAAHAVISDTHHQLRNRASTTMETDQAALRTLRAARWGAYVTWLLTTPRTLESGESLWKTKSALRAVLTSLIEPPRFGYSISYQLDFPHLHGGADQVSPCRVSSSRSC